MLLLTDRHSTAALLHIMAQAPRLTRELLAVHEGSAADYASEAGCEAGSEAGDVAPSSRGAAPAHDPYARSAPTFRGALQGLGLDPTGAKGSSRLRPSSGASASAGRSASFASYRSDFSRMDAWTRHQQLASDYVKYYGGKWEHFRAPTTQRTDADILREAHRFVRTEEDDAAGGYEQRMAKRYYDQLFREYTLADLSRYKEGAIGMRWRTEAEVLAGKGQFSCGNKRCSATEGLQSFELNFGYEEAGQIKQALVKLRLCPECARMLHYQKLQQMERAEKEARRQVKREKRESKREKKSKRSSSSHKHKRKRRHDSDSSSDSSSGSSDDEVDRKPRSSSSSSSSSSRKAARVESASAPASGAAAGGAVAPPNHIATPPASAAPAFAVPLPRSSRHVVAPDAPGASSAHGSAAGAPVAPFAAAAAAVSPQSESAQCDELFERNMALMFP